MGLLRQQMIQEINALRPAELIAVQSLIEVIKQQASPIKPVAGEGRMRTRTALSGIKGSMTELVSSDRDDRV